MRVTRRFVTFAATLGLAAPSLLQVSRLSAQSSEEAAVLQAVDALTKAMLDADRARLEELVADQLSYGHSSGVIQTKAQFVDAIRRRFQADSKIVVGCNSGKRSALAVRALVDSGFANVVECRTGWDGTRGIFGELREAGWKRVGLPTENGSPKHS